MTSMLKAFGIVGVSGVKGVKGVKGGGSFWISVSGLISFSFYFILEMLMVLIGWLNWLLLLRSVILGGICTEQ